MLSACPGAPIVAVICGNGGTYRSGITTRWLADNPRLLVIRGARCNPQDNPVEWIWAVMTQDISAVETTPLDPGDCGASDRAGS